MSLVPFVVPAAKGCRRAGQRVTRWLFVMALLAVPPLIGQTRVEGLDLSSVAIDSSGALPFFCPMDPDIRAETAGVCSRCGMQLVLGPACASGVPGSIGHHSGSGAPGRTRAVEV